MNQATQPTTQRQAVASFLTDHGAITSNDAIAQYGITRLAEYIRQLRRDGWKIETERIVFTNRFGHTGACAKYILKAAQ